MPPETIGEERWWRDDANGNVPMPIRTTRTKKMYRKTTPHVFNPLANFDGLYRFSLCSLLFCNVRSEILGLNDCEKTKRSVNNVHLSKKLFTYARCCDDHRFLRCFLTSTLDRLSHRRCSKWQMDSEKKQNENIILQSAVAIFLFFFSSVSAVSCYTWEKTTVYWLLCVA